MPLDWSTTLPDWKERLREGRSLIPDLPLDEDRADKALRLFKQLRAPDITGFPTYGECCEKWVFDLVRVIFGAVDIETRLRALSEFFVLVPKKNGKTSIAAAIIVVAAILNEHPDSELLLIAPTIQIAERAFKQCAGIIRLTVMRSGTRLSDLFSVHSHERRIRLLNPEMPSEIVIKAADTDVVTGSKARYVLIDETHEFATKPKAADVFVELRGGVNVQGNLGFLLQITTQSKSQPAGVFANELKTARQVRDGQIVLPMLAVLYELPPEVAKDGGWKDRATWPMVNPHLNKGISEDKLASELVKAEMQGPAALALFASQHFNVEIGVGLSIDTWIGAQFWDACAAPGLDLDSLLARSDVAVVGLDGGGLDDLLGGAVIGREIGTRKWLIWTHAWAHPEVLDRRKEIAPKLMDFASAGDLTVCTHASQGHEEAARLILKVLASGLLPEANGVGLDHGQAAPIMDALESVAAEEGVTIGEGLLCGIRQGGGLRGPIWNMELKLKAKTVEHGGQKMMNWVIGNAKAQQVGSMVVIEKVAAGKAKIDPLIAVLNGAELLGRNPQAGRAASYLDTEELLVM
jgi:phage terminase large subunit-like protein